MVESDGAENDFEVVIDEKKQRKYYVDLIDKIQNEEDVADFITLISTLDRQSLEFALPSLCLLSVFSISDQMKMALEQICADVMLDPESARGSRRAAIACMKEMRKQLCWQDFYVLAEAIEEPQFHIIRPVLPRMDSLLTAVENNKIGFVWAKVIILRAILHSNGWIRVWAIEKAIDVNATVLAENFEILTELIIPNINNNDVFWRCLEKQQIEQFLTSFGKALGNVMGTISDDEKKVKFLFDVLSSFENISCPTSMFFMSSILHNIGSQAVLSNEHVPLQKRVLYRARYIPHKSMRITTIKNLIVFYTRVTVLNSKYFDDVAQMIQIISHEATKEMIDDLFGKIEVVLKESKYTTDDIVDEELFFASAIDNHDLREYSRMWWSSMLNQEDKQKLIIKRIELRISELLSTNYEFGSELNCYLYLLHQKPDNAETNVLKLMSNQFGEYILKRIMTSRGTKSDFDVLNKLYIPLFFEYCQDMIEGSAVVIIHLMQNQLTCESHTILLSFFDALVEKMKNKDAINEKFFEYFGDVANIGLKRQKKSIDELEPKEFNNIVSILHSLRLKLLYRFMDENPEKAKLDVDSFLQECIEQLDVASAFSVKQKICELISKFIIKTTNYEIVSCCIRACSNIVNEEKKSLNSLPALECFVQVAMNAQKNDEIVKETIKQLEDQLSIANQSTQVALVIVNAVAQHVDKIDTKWAEFIVKLALFGPVPKKESRVLSYVYSTIYEHEKDTDGKSLLERDDIERQDITEISLAERYGLTIALSEMLFLLDGIVGILFHLIDEVVQRARFKAIVLATKLGESSEKWAIAIVKEIIAASKLMDQSSSRSFGLSMAHRQKTRAVQLIHLLVNHINQKKFIEELFDYCISCIVDPCQQFSIKLVVEWTISCICLKNNDLFLKLISEEFEKSMAENRIGSVSSWINVLTLISRSEKLLVTLCLHKVVSWTSAQNFPVRCTAIAACRLMYSLLSDTEKEKYLIVKSIVEFSAEPSGNSRRVIDNLCEDFYFAKLHTDKHYDMQTILIEISKKTGMPPEETIPINIIEELNSTKVRSINKDDTFLNAPSLVYSALMKNASSAPSMEIEKDNEKETEITDEDAENIDDVEPASFQRKIVKEEDEKKNEDVSLIVVASLVDKPNNLGGICRTCEIFGVDTLVISDVILAQDSNFRALSMSSENWQKIEGVRPQNLLGYLENLRANGYTVIAVEQTTDSVMMHDFVFPKKSVIVMGDEKEGVPVSLLRAVDQTVEIKQVGHTRSLNVHVTAALMISKFAEQVRFKS